MFLQTGKGAYQDIGLLSAFATVALSFLGFKYRFSPWTPNRHYVSGKLKKMQADECITNAINGTLLLLSGFILVALFSTLNVIGLITLIVTKPMKGSPLHDVTTAIVSTLSTLILLFICLGFVSSRLCQAPPIDPKIEVI